MSANQIISMILRSVMRQLINRGVKAGFDRMGRGAAGRGAVSPERAEQQRIRKARRAARDTGR
jgi:hypothetical protein